ncbi:hypothetical protein AVEN_40556-1 [Araneus ventricosus]|uniref:Uncharacterized protein n=1 Tax=Araneus ventricosus TaxID=182803 RepID=A0A4Y2A3V1_ARAVE|nr:hypothetical protein AVEN_40556-1 [Araneus ventricosus]
MAKIRWVSTICARIYRKEERASKKTENKCKRRLYECKIYTKKERYIVKRDCERLQIECVSSSSLPYNPRLRADKLFPKKRTIHSQYISEQNMAMRLEILGQCFMAIQKQI